MMTGCHHCQIHGALTDLQLAAPAVARLRVRVWLAGRPATSLGQRLGWLASFVQCSDAPALAHSTQLSLSTSAQPASVHLCQMKMT